MGPASSSAKEMVFVECANSADFSGVTCFKWQYNFIKH